MTVAQEEIANLLRQRSGLDVESIGRAAIARAVRRRMVHCETSRVEEYRDRIAHSEAEMQELIELVAVPETWFFRDPEAFEALAHLVWNEWLPRARSRVLRLLSLPCSTGEEPYSIAMTLLDSGLPAERFQIDAMDISHRALHQAERAVYARNSFRGTKLQFRAHHFEEHSDGFHLAPAIRSAVQFRQANLLTSTLPSGDARYDVVFCRNLLIYFDRPTQEKAIAKFDELLKPQGYLFVGPAEAYLVRSTFFTALLYPKAFAFQKSTPVARETSPQIPASRPAPPTKTKALAGRAAKTPLKRRALSAPSVASTPVPKRDARQERELQPDLEIARRLADEGQLDEAAAQCMKHLNEGEASAAAYSLLGVVRDAMGDEREAAACYRKALYLEPENVEALAHLSLLLERQGDVRGAQRLRERTQRVEGRTERENEG